MRTRDEIERALTQMRDAFHAASYLNDPVQTKALSAVIMALRWMRGDNDPTGFAAMLAQMEAMDETIAAVERHERN